MRVRAEADRGRRPATTLLIRARARLLWSSAWRNQLECADDRGEQHQNDVRARRPCLRHKRASRGALLRELFTGRRRVALRAATATPCRSTVIRVVRTTLTRQGLRTTDNSADTTPTLPLVPCAETRHAAFARTGRSATVAMQAATRYMREAHAPVQMLLKKGRRAQAAAVVRGVVRANAEARSILAAAGITLARRTPRATRSFSIAWRPSSGLRRRDAARRRTLSGRPSRL